MAEITALQAAEGAQNLAKMYSSVLAIRDVLLNIGSLEAAADNAVAAAEAARKSRDEAMAEGDAVRSRTAEAEEKLTGVMKLLADAQDAVQVVKINADSEAGAIYQAAQVEAGKIVAAANRDAQRVRDEFNAEIADFKAVIAGLASEKMEYDKKIVALRKEIEDIRAMFK